MYLKLLRLFKLFHYFDLNSKFIFRLNIIIIKFVNNERARYLCQQLFDSLYNKPNKLRNSNLPPIEVLICCTEKDSEKLRYSIEGVLRNSLNPISRIILVSPTQLEINMSENTRNTKINIINDNDVLIPSIEKFISSQVPSHRKGWITQQCIKIMYALNSTADYLLILDSDTILTQPHAFVNNNKVQLLSFSYEYHIPYVRHTNKYLGIKSEQLSYVTHYQLWQKAYMTKIYPLGEVSLLDWLGSADFSQDSAVSEFHTYGSWLISNQIDSIVMTSWSNLNVRPREWFRGSNVLDGIQNAYGKINSVSLHSYLS